MSTENSLHPTNTQTEIGADVNFNTIPESMRVLRQWCVWGKRTEVGVDVCNVNKKGESKLDKTPFNPVTGKMAESNNPETWESFENVLNAYELGFYNGIGFVFNYETDGLAGIDLDHCFEDGQINDEAKSIVEKFPGAFIEISPSGDGVHIYVKGMPMHCGKGKRNKWIECYGRGINGKKSNRYFCVTGHLFGDNAVNGCEIADGQSGLFWVDENYKKVVEKKPQPVNVPRDKASVQNMQDRDDESEKVEDALRYVNPDDSYETWLKIGMALKDGGYTVDVWDSWSAQGGKYKSGGCQKKWDSFKSSGVGIGTLFEYAKNSGFNNQARPNINEAQKPPSPPDDSVPVGGARGDSRQTLPEICLNGTRLNKQHDLALRALQQRNNPPRILVHHGKLSRVEQHHNKKVGEVQIRVTSLTVSTLRYELERSAFFFTYNQKEGTQTPMPPSNILCEDILARPSYENFPDLVRVVTAPIVTTDGHVIVKPGYDNKSGVFYHAPVPLNLPSIEPTKKNLEWAKSLLFNHLLVDFPFTSEADRANAVAYFIVPFCREMIKGPTPLHLMSAPAQGSGKTLLGELLTHVFNPLQGFAAIPKSISADDEWRKMITSKLLGQASHLFFDNVTGKLESPSLANVLTSEKWSDRLLGQNVDINIDNPAIWAMTGNNLTLGEDMVRRTVEIRLDAQCENPADRESFKHSNIKGWAIKYRAELIGAALILINNWLDKGKPEPRDVPVMGSFEHWRHVVGGILETAQIAGFLQNKQTTAQRVDSSYAQWMGFFELWYEKYGDILMKPNELHSVAKEVGLFDDVLFSKTERGEISRLGKKLAVYEDRIFAGLKLERARMKKNSQYRLIKVEGVLGGTLEKENGKVPLKEVVDNSSVGVLGGTLDTSLASRTRENTHNVLVDTLDPPYAIDVKKVSKSTPSTPIQIKTTSCKGVLGGVLGVLWQDTTKSVYERAKDFYLNFQKGTPNDWDKLCNDGYAFSDLVEEMNKKCS